MRSHDARRPAKSCGPRRFGRTDDNDTATPGWPQASAPLAQRINALINAEPANDSPSRNGARVVIEQAMASITRTTKERFAASQTMLEKALVDDPDNIDLAVSLAALQLRGVQMVWYTPAESAAAESRARAILERGLKRKPGYLPLLEAYCRFLNATNQFVESLVACARVLSFDPGTGRAVSHRPGSGSVGPFRRGTCDVQAGRQFRHAACVVLDLEARCGDDLSADGSQRRSGAMAATLDRHHARDRTQLHAVIRGLSGSGAAGRGKSRDGKGNGAAARLQPRQCLAAVQERQPDVPGRKRADRTRLRRRGIARALTLAPDTGAASGAPARSYLLDKLSGYTPNTCQLLVGGDGFEPPTLSV